MLALVLAVSAAVPVLDPDDTYPLPNGTDFRIGRPSRSAGPGFIGAKFSTDGKKLATLTQTGATVRCAVTGRRLWGRNLLQLHGSGSADGLAFSPDGRKLAFVGFSQITVADLATGSEIELNARASEDGWFEASHVRFASAGVVRVFGRQRLATKDDSPYVAVDFDPDTGARLARRELPGKPRFTATDGQVLILSDEDGYRRFDTTVWRYVGKPLHTPDGASTLVGADADCRRVVRIVRSKAASVSDAKTGKEVRTVTVLGTLNSIDGSMKSAEAVLSPDGEDMVVWFSQTGFHIDRWRVADGKELPPLSVGAFPECMIHGPRTNAITVIDQGELIHTFDRITGKRIGVETQSLSFGTSHNGKWVANFDGAWVTVRDAKTGLVTSRFHSKQAASSSFAVSDDGAKLFVPPHPAGQPIPGTQRTVAVDGNQLLLHETKDGKAITSLVAAVRLPPGHPGESSQRKQPAVSANGRVIAVSTSSYVDLFTGNGEYLRRVRIIPPPDETARLIHSDWVRYTGPVALSADGRWLAVQHVSYITSGGFPPSGSVEIYETATGGFVTKIEQRFGTPAPLAFAPSGRHLWTTENSEALRWSLKPPPAVVFNRANLLPDLTSDDARTAYLAAGRLAFPDMLKYLGEQLPPDKFVDPARVAKLVKQLGDREFAVRETAAAALVAMGPAVSAALRAEAKAPANPESGRRAAAVLGRIDRDDAPAVLLRRRAVAAVAMLADDHPDARKLLDAWATGDPGLPLTIAARAALAK